MPLHARTMGPCATVKKVAVAASSKVKHTVAAFNRWNENISYKSSLVWKEWPCELAKLYKHIDFRDTQPCDFVQDDIAREGWLDDNRSHLRLAMVDIQRKLIERDQERLLKLAGETPTLLEPGEGAKGQATAAFAAHFDFTKRCRSRPGILGLPDVFHHDDLVELGDKAVQEARRILLNRRTFSSPKNVVQAMDLVSNIVCCVADAAAVIEQLHPSPTWRLAAQKTLQHVQEFIANVNVDQLLYDRLRFLALCAERGTWTESEMTEDTLIQVRNQLASSAGAGSTETPGDSKDSASFKRPIAGAHDSVDLKTSSDCSFLYNKFREGLTPHRDHLPESVMTTSYFIKEEPKFSLHPPKSKDLVFEPASSSPASSSLESQPETAAKSRTTWIDLPTVEEKKVLVSMIEAMEQQGVHLQHEEDRERYLSLLREERRQCAKVLQNTQHASSIPDVWVLRRLIEGLALDPKSFPSRRSPTGLIEVCIPGGSFLADELLKTSPFPSVRRAIWKARRGVLRSADDALRELAKTRYRLAKIRGFKSWSEFSKREGILRSHDAADKFIARVIQALLPGLREEIQLLRSLKHTWVQQHADTPELVNDGEDHTEVTTVKPWDVPFFTHQLKAVNDVASQLGDRLTIQKLLMFYSIVLDRLFGVVLNPVRPAAEETWHSSVIKFHLMRKTGESTVDSMPLGTLYLDLFDRENKPRIDAQFSVRGSREMNYAYKENISEFKLAYLGVYPFGSSTGPFDGNSLLSMKYRQTPLVVMVSNLLGASAYSHDVDRDIKETVVTPAEARNIFHELGHATHALLSRTVLQHLSGTRGPVDFTEFVSHFFEHLITTPECFMKMLPFESGDMKLLRRYKKTVNLFGHLEAFEIALKAAIDQAVHSADVFLPSDEESQSFDGDKSSPTYQQHLHRQLLQNPHYGTLLQETFTPGEASILDLVTMPIASRFEHLVHYGGMFYCYIYNRAASSWVWENAFGGNLLEDPRNAGGRLYKLLKQGSADATIIPIVGLFDSGRQPNSVTPPTSSDGNSEPKEKNRKDPTVLDQEVLQRSTQNTAAEEELNLDTVKKSPESIPLEPWIKLLSQSLP